MQFLFEKLVFDKAFVKFVYDTYSSARICSEYVSNPVAKKTLQDAVCEVGEKFFFEIFPRANIKDMVAVGSVGEAMSKAFAANPEKSAKLLQNLCGDPERLANLIVRCPEQRMRSSVGKGILAAFIAVFVEEKEKFEKETAVVTHKLMDRMVDMIGYDLMTNWTKFAEFFELLKNLVFAGGIPLLKYSFAQDLPARLLDLFLERQSPAKLQARRQDMGNSSQSPDFGPLMELVSYFVRHTKIAAGSMSPPTELAGEFKLSATALKCIQADELIPKFVRNGGKLEQVGKLLVHLSFANRKFSKRCCKLMLQSLNSYDATVLGQCIEVMRDLLGIEDEVQELRTEWLLGYCQPIDRPQYGLAGVLDISDDTNCYISPIGVATRDDPLLQHIWKSRAKSEQFTLQALKTVLQASERNDKLYHYLKRMPAPNYVGSYYFDWVPGFLDRVEQNPSVVSFYNRAEKATVLTELRGLVEVFAKRVASEDLRIGYVIGKTLSMAEIKEMEKSENGTRLVLSQLETEVYEGRGTEIEKGYLEE